MMRKGAKIDAQHRYFVEGRPRTSHEQSFYIDMHPCPQCGCEEWEHLCFGTYNNVDPDPSKATDHHDVACPQCGLARRFVFLTEAYRPDGTSLGGPEPSEMIAPHEFLAYYDHLRPRVAEHPDRLEYAEADRAYSALYKLGRLAPELAKFLPSGAIAVPADAQRTEAARAAIRQNPERYTREYLEGLAQEVVRLRAIYKANIPDFQRKTAAYEAANPPPPPPKPPAFTPESLEAHRLFATRKPGTTAGLRLEAEDVAQVGARLGAKELSHSRLTRVDLSRADLGMADAHHVEWTDVTLVEARLGSTAMHSSVLTRCDFSGAGMGLTKLGDCRIDDCRFDRAHLDRSSWYRSDVTNCTFDGAVFGQAALDEAVFVDCSFRGASFARERGGVMGGMRRAWFYRCDFRGVDWTSRDLVECVFIDCLFGGARGTDVLLYNAVPFRCAAEPGGPHLDLHAFTALLSAQRKRLYDQSDPDTLALPRANPRTIHRRILRDGQPIEEWYDEHSALILAEHERDPSSPLPVDFSVW